jgi:hypothetical protein
MNKEGTLASRLGVTTHVSPLRIKLRRVMETYPVADASTLEDWLLDLANARGVTVVSRSLDKLGPPGTPFPGPDEVSNAELAVAICQAQSLDRPQWLRAAAQLIARGDIPLPELLLMARRERVERILAELARQSLKVDPDHAAWKAIDAAFGDLPPLRDSLVHWTRLAEPVMAPGKPNAARWELVR